MLIGAVADIHGNFDALTLAMKRHPEVPFWLCVGDVGSVTGTYPTPAAPMYWIKGNNEAFDRLEALPLLLALRFLDRLQALPLLLARCQRDDLEVRVHGAPTEPLGWIG